MLPSGDHSGVKGGMSLVFYRVKPAPDPTSPPRSSATHSPGLLLPVPPPAGPGDKATSSLGELPSSSGSGSDLLGTGRAAQAPPP